MVAIWLLLKLLYEGDRIHCIMWKWSSTVLQNMSRILTSVFLVTITLLNVHRQYKITIHLLNLQQQQRRKIIKFCSWWCNKKQFFLRLITNYYNPAMQTFIIYAVPSCESLLCSLPGPHQNLLLYLDVSYTWFSCVRTRY